MADFAPPSGPPPPKLPDGWKAVFNDQYKEWFYVNIYTGQSQWEKPTSPAQPGDGAPAGAPPGYANPGRATASDHKQASFESNNPYNQSHATESDAQLAARLQAEEDARARGQTAGGDRGAGNGYYGGGPDAPQYGGGASYGPGQSAYAGDQAQTASQSGRSTGHRSLFGKLLGKSKSHQATQHQPQGHGPPPGPGGYPPQGYYPAQGYGGGYGGGYGPGYGPGYGRNQQGGRSGGMGALGAGALGLGGGLLGGALLADAFDGGGDGGDGGDGGGDGGGGGDS